MTHGQWPAGRYLAEVVTRTADEETTREAWVEDLAAEEATRGMRPSPEREAAYEAEDEARRTPQQRSVHQVLHDLGVGHACDGSWIDHYDWEHLADGLINRGWTPPAS